MDKKERIVISLGGSLIFPEHAPDADYLALFKDVIDRELKEGKTFFITTGGGNITRVYQNVFRGLESNPTSDALDWIGIAPTRLNAQLVRELFGDVAHKEVITNPTAIDADSAVIVGGGWKPGWSTDYVAVAGAVTLGARKVINLTNVAYVYDKNPNVHDDAKKLEDISWDDYLSVIPNEWAPGLNTPFDPVASKLAKENNIEVAIVAGTNITALKNCIEGKDFEGTRIHP